MRDQFPKGLAKILHAGTGPVGYCLPLDTSTCTPLHTHTFTRTHTSTRVLKERKVNTADRPHSHILGVNLLHTRNKVKVNDLNRQGELERASS